jgi:hypothetical protein
MENTMNISDTSEKHSDYSGPLAEPLPRPHPLEGEAAVNAWISACMDKMRLLMLHYRIDPKDPGASIRLSCALAHRHVPGFQPAPRKPGRPAERGDFALVMLFALLTKGYGMSQRQASRAINRDGCVPGSVDTLRKRCRTPAAKVFAHFFENLFAHFGKEKFVRLLEQTVDDVLPPGGAISI